MSKQIQQNLGKQLLRKNKEFAEQLKKVEKLLSDTDKLKNEIADLREKVVSTHFEKIIRLAREHPEVPVDDFQKILGETVNSLQEFIDKKSESADVTTKVKTEKIESEPVKPAVKVETVETNPVKVNQRQQTNVAQNLPAEVKPQNSVVAPVNVVANKISQPVNNSEEEEPNLDTEEGIARWFNGGK